MHPMHRLALPCLTLLTCRAGVLLTLALPVWLAIFEMHKRRGRAGDRVVDASQAPASNADGGVAQAVPGAAPPSEPLSAWLKPRMTITAM